MKSASAGLIALLAAGTPTFQADCISITLLDATVLRWTTWDDALTIDSGSFSAVDGVVSRSNTRCVAGLEVDTLTLNIGTDITILVLGISASLAAQNGAFDGARVMVERAFMSTPGTVVGTLTMFEGAVAGIDITATRIKLSAKSDLDRLNVDIPRNLFLPRCGVNLYDSGCGLNVATFTVAGTLTGTPTTTTLPSDLVAASGYYNLGVLVMTSGPATGARRGVRGYISGTLYLSTPLPATPAAGNTFTVYPGCEHTTSACETKFSNLLRFRGFPYVPRVESAR